MNTVERLLLALCLATLVACAPAPEEVCSAVVDTGFELPAATISDCDGNSVSLLELIEANEVTYISFGAGWCTACQEEIPELNALKTEFEGKNVGIVQILVEGMSPGVEAPLGLCGQWAGDALPPIAEFPVWIDVEQSMICDHFGEAVGTLPVHLLVTGDGTVQSRIVGALPADMSARISDWL
ncbi:MAG: hypothetical protein CL940_06505 [Deltaproteobacteria bacterium]|nr:hypothetical protein [Deltaproteobacteria bacterium]